MRLEKLVALERPQDIPLSIDAQGVLLEDNGPGYQRIVAAFPRLDEMRHFVSLIRKGVSGGDTLARCLTLLVFNLKQSLRQEKKRGLAKQYALTTLWSGLNELAGDESLPPTVAMKIALMVNTASQAFDDVEETKVQSNGTCSRCGTTLGEQFMLSVAGDGLTTLECGTCHLQRCDEPICSVRVLRGEVAGDKAIAHTRLAAKGFRWNEKTQTAERNRDVIR